MKLHIVAACISALLSSHSAHAEDQVLLRGELLTEGEIAQTFSLSGESRDMVIGGEIRLNSHVFNIKKVSVHNLVGAQRLTDKGQQFIVFSSSYSEQTATGKPWVKAKVSHSCDTPYNSFLALYTVDSAKKLAQLADVPFAELVESLDYSDDSQLYCFIAKPPKDVTKT